MKNKYAWLILGIVIGIVVSIAACWIWCCSCNSSCATSCGGKCVHLIGADSLKQIPADSVKLALHPQTTTTVTEPATTRTMSMSVASTTTTTALLKAFNVNKQALAAMNTLSGNTAVNTFRIYLKYTSGVITGAYVLGVNTAGLDLATSIFTVPASGVGPCPDICDTSSPLY